MTLLRSLAFSVWLYCATAVVSLRVTLLAHDRPAVVAGAKLWARVMLAGLRRICGIDYVVTGREHLPAGAALIAPMHQSAFDTIVWLLLVPDCAYVLKRELTRLPLFGRLLVRGGQIPVDRNAGAAAMRDLIRRAAAAAAGRQILIFPEGTRAAPGEPIRLHPGVAAIAARTGLPIIPVATDSGHFWGRRSFRKRPGTIRIAILPPLPVGLPRAAVMARLEQAYAEGYAALRGGKAVDNSVGDVHPEPPNQPSGLS